MNEYKPGEVQKVKIFLFASINHWDCGRVFAWPFPDYQEQKAFSEAEIDVILPETFNPVAEQVSILKIKLEKISEDYYKQKSVIEEKIQNLLCIENGASS